MRIPMHIGLLVGKRQSKRQCLILVTKEHGWQCKFPCYMYMTQKMLFLRTVLYNWTSLYLLSAKWLGAGCGRGGERRKDYQEEILLMLWKVKLIIYTSGMNPLPPSLAKNQRKKKKERKGLSRIQKLKKNGIENFTLKKFFKENFIF